MTTLRALWYLARDMACDAVNDVVVLVSIAVGSLWLLAAGVVAQVVLGPQMGPPPW